MKILLIGDEESKYIWNYFDPDKFKDIDLILSSGDLDPKYLSFLVTMIKAPLYYVHGNHDIKYKYCEPSGCDCIDDKIIEYKGIRILGLGGSQKYNKNEFQYTEKEMSRRILKLTPKIWLNKGFDILLTHSPAYELGDGKDLCHTGFKCFRDLMKKYEPSYMVFGHYHLNYSNNDRITSFYNTTLINAYCYHILEYSQNKSVLAKRIIES